MPVGWFVGSMDGHFPFWELGLALGGQQMYDYVSMFSYGNWFPLCLHPRCDHLRETAMARGRGVQ